MDFNFSFITEPILIRVCLVWLCSKLKFFNVSKSVSIRVSLRVINTILFLPRVRKPVSVVILLSCSNWACSIS